MVFLPLRVAMSTLTRTLHEQLPRVWQQRGILAWLLWPLSLIYGLALSLRRRLYRWGLFKTEQLPVPVIVVGNLIAGGAGKTPVVQALVQHLQAQGLRVGIVSRGYGRTIADGQDCREVHSHDLAQFVGDEPLLLKRSTQAPVFVARRRIHAARALLAAYAQTQLIICDDGLQHLALHRNASVCVFDDRGAGNGFLLPAGALRERHVDVTWTLLSHPVGELPLHSAQGRFAMDRQLAPYALRSDGSRVPLSELRGSPLQALAGIARPQVFFDMLRAQGLQLATTQALPDHYDFAHDFPNTPTHTPTRAGSLPCLICTEKDAVKLWRHQPHALAVPLLVTLPVEFLQAVLTQVQSWLSLSPHSTDGGLD